MWVNLLVREEQELKEFLLNTLCVVMELGSQIFADCGCAGVYACVFSHA